MNQEGPALEMLTRRLAEMPVDFMAAPVAGGSGSVHTAAVVQDLLVMLGGPVLPSLLEPFEGSDPKRDRNRLSVTLALCWLLADDWFGHGRVAPPAALELLDGLSRELSKGGSADRLSRDPERREELARLVLGRLGYRPAGESVAVAEDRLTSISSAERARVLRASRAAEERARQVREALMRKAAEESADKWTRE